MELRHLRYFIAAGEELNFHIAATRLNVSPPAVSHLIQNMEKELGVELFERLPRGVRLTPAGKSFLTDAQQLLAGLKQAAERIQRIARGQLGSLRIGFNTVSSTHPVMRKSISIFHTAHPDVEIELRRMTSVQQFDAIHVDKIDIGCVYADMKSFQDLEFMELQRDDILLALPASHRLARRPKIHLSDLKTEPFVGIRKSVNASYYEILLEACLSNGFSPRIVQEIESQPAVINLVSIGIGVAFLNAAQAEACPSAVVLKRIADLDAQYHLGIIWRRTTRSPVVANFVQTVSSVLGLAKSERGQRRETR